MTDDALPRGGAELPTLRPPRTLRIVARELGPVVGIGRRALHRHPIWTETSDEGRGVGVVVVPGFGGSDASMAVPRRWLARRGYRASGAGLGLTLGCTTGLVERLERRAEDLADATGGPVVLFGHSRGGWLSRLVAVRRPDLVRGLAMMGSPVLNPLDARGAAILALRMVVGASRLGIGDLLSRDCLHGACRDVTEEGLAAPLAVPAVSIWSRGDGVVGWRSCRDPAAESVEIHCSHTAMGIDPELYTVLAPRLAAWAGPGGPAGRGDHRHGT